MIDASDTARLESLQSLQSTIGKAEKALTQMARKSADTALLERRLEALYIGLAVLEHVWNRKPYRYTQEELAEARDVLTGLVPSIESIYANLKAGSPQRTLIERRVRALELAAQAIDDLSRE